MLQCFDFARDMSFLAVTVRMVLAVFCGGLIGIEREYKRRPAGFRTHILICLGAAITTLTSQYLYLTLELYTDVAPRRAGCRWHRLHRRGHDNRHEPPARQGADDCRRTVDKRHHRACVRRGVC